MIRRAIGLVFILVGLSGLAICYLGARAGRDLADNVELSAGELLETAGITLTTVEESLEQSRQTISSISGAIAQVRTTMANLALTVDDTQPTLDDLARLVGEDIPGTISDVQDTIPNIAQTAKVVDDTLRLLSRLRVEETVPLINYEISFGLGVEYNPEVPFDQAVEQVGRGLDPIAVASENLEGNLQTTKGNMAVLSQDLNGLTGDLDQLDEEIRAMRPLLDEYSTQAAEMQDAIVDGRQRLSDQLSVIKKALVLVAVWLSLFQLLPLYFGLELLTGSRMVRAADIPPYDSDLSVQLSGRVAPVTRVGENTGGVGQETNPDVAGDGGVGEES